MKRWFPWLMAVTGMIVLLVSNGLTAAALSVYDESLLNKFGWTRVDFPYNEGDRFHQAYVGIQHSAAGQFVSVGHAATMLYNDFTCGTDAITEPGNIDFGAVVVAQ